MVKAMDNTCMGDVRKNTPSLEVFGDGDLWQLLVKVSSATMNGWMKSTKALEIPNVGCLVQVTTQYMDNVAEALTFVPGVRVEGEGENRKIVAIDR